jgi:hypothetical protein
MLRQASMDARVKPAHDDENCSIAKGSSLPGLTRQSMRQRRFLRRPPIRFLPMHHPAPSGHLHPPPPKWGRTTNVVLAARFVRVRGLLHGKNENASQATK